MNGKEIKNGLEALEVRITFPYPVMVDRAAVTNCFINRYIEFGF